MNRPRIVLDTNVLISAGLKPFGAQAQLVKLLALKKFNLCVSDPVLAEYREVFGRAKFAHIHPDVFGSMLALIESRGTRFEHGQELTISPHDSDNRFYECADAAEADYIRHGKSQTLHQTPQEHEDRQYPPVA